MNNGSNIHTQIATALMNRKPSAFDLMGKNDAQKAAYGRRMFSPQMPQAQPFTPPTLPQNPRTAFMPQMKAAPPVSPQATFNQFRQAMPGMNAAQFQSMSPFGGKR